METKVENLEENKVKLTIELSVEEMKPYLEKAANELAENTDIPGFRPGKADYKTIAARVGETKILEQAAEAAVRGTLFTTLHEQKIENVGQPKIDIAKMAPNNPFIYTAEIALMPKVTKLADYKSIKIKAEEVKVEDKDVDQALGQIQKMQTKEVRSTKPATKEDKVVVDLKMLQDNVPLEGGEGQSHAVFLAEEHYIPGFCEKLVGAKEGEDVKFTLKFPEEHFQKHLSGKDVDFEVKVKEIFELQHPELNDEFAKALGQKSIDELKTVLKENISNEKTQEESGRQEREMLETLANKSQFEEIPDLLVNEEINKMIQELEHNVAGQGLKLEEYLKQINKDMGQLKLDFTPQALMRIKVALLTKEVAKLESVEVTDDELDTEIDHIASHYDDGTDQQKRVYDPMYREYTAHIMRNRKVIDLLREMMIEKK